MRNPLVLEWMPAPQGQPLRPLSAAAITSAQHCCQTPSEAVIGRQCHIQPSGSRAAPMLDVTSSCECVPEPEPEPEEPWRAVVVLVASFAKVPMMSEAKHTHSSWLSR